MQRGTINYVHPTKRFGFIKPDEVGAPDCFFYAGVLEGLQFDPLLNQLAVEYTTQDAPKGPKAITVRKAH